VATDLVVIVDAIQCILLYSCMYENELRWHYNIAEASLHHSLRLLTPAHAEQDKHFFDYKSNRPISMQQSKRMNFLIPCSPVAQVYCCSVLQMPQFVCS
jgi:hypothetical protein